MFVKGSQLRRDNICREKRFLFTRNLLTCLLSFECWLPFCHLVNIALLSSLFVNFFLKIQTMNFLNNEIAPVFFIIITIKDFDRQGWCAYYWITLIAFLIKFRETWNFKSDLREAANGLRHHSPISFLRWVSSLFVLIVIGDWMTYWFVRLNFSKC